MAGHSKWANIKHKKGAADAKRGKLFSKLIKEVTVAAKMGGSDLASNPRLRTAVLACKAGNMTKDTIDKAIKKGAGELGDGTAYEEISYEAYGPEGSAFIIEVLTDNKNRSLSNVRAIVTRNSGNMANTGAVGWNFTQKGLIIVNAEGVDEDEIMEFALEAGAEDIANEGEVYEIIVEPSNYNDVAEKFNESSYTIEVSEITMVPGTTVKLSGKHAEQALRLIDKLEDDDDVQKIYHNAEIEETS
ncbi:MAG: YebC/PmpR family DNA-binding transcriptional regulator [Nitrospinae bacterium]|nr:YebC/PmpR family DNA-binding transcriptional regulator [Nitrospinota bacterium]